MMRPLSKNGLAALQYAKNGWQVFPLHHPLGPGQCSCGNPKCQAPAKHPLTGRGWKDATTSEARIRHWWGNNPDANIGVATGAASGILVLDVDTAGGKKGVDSLHALTAAIGPLPKTLTARTGSGGQHLVFRSPESRALRNTAGKLGPGLDTRGDGGYIVAPPSLHATMEEYAWIETDVPLADLPVRLIERLEAKKPPAALDTMRVDGHASHPYGTALLSKLSADLMQTQVGARNDGLNKAAFRLGQFSESCGVPIEQAKAVMLNAASACGLELREAINTFQSGWDAGCSQPQAPSQQTAAAARALGTGGLSTLEASASRFKLLSPKELSELPPITWLVDEVLPQGGLAIVYGPPGSGKTFFTLGLALRVSLGLNWSARKVQQGNVIYVAAEGISGLPQRIQAWTMFHGHELQNLFAIQDPVNLHDSRDVSLFVAAVQHCAPKLIIFDTLARCTNGCDENSAKDMGHVIAGLDQIRWATGATIVVVHHSGKSSSDSERGSGALRGAADTMILVKSKGSKMIVTCEKQKDVAPFAESRWLLSEVERSNSCVIAPEDDNSPRRDPTRQATLTDAQMRVLSVVREWSRDGKGIRRKELWPAAGVSNSGLHHIIKKLEEEGLIYLNSRSGTYLVPDSNTFEVVRTEQRSNEVAPLERCSM